MKKSIVIAFALALSATSVPASAGSRDTTVSSPEPGNFSLWSFGYWFSGKMSQISGLRGF